MDGNAVGDWPTDRNCCTIVVYPGESIQAAIDALPPQGGCVCLKSGIHEIDSGLNIPKSNVILHGEAPGTRIVMTKPAGGMLSVGDFGGGTLVENVEITHITFDYSVYFDPPDGPTILGLVDCRRVRVIHCEFLYTNKQEKMLIHGIALNHADDIHIEDNLFDRMVAGVYAFDYASAVLVADNIFRGQLQETEFGPDTYNGEAVRLAMHADGTVRDNVIENFQMGVQAYGSHVEVIGNRIRPLRLPLELEATVVPNTGIRVQTRQPPLVHANDIELPSGFDTGISVACDEARITGNIIRSTYEKPTADGPVAITVGEFGYERILIADNQLIGPQTGIRVKNGTAIHIADNVIAGGDAAPIAIELAGCHECLVSDHEIRNVVTPFMITDGVRNRVVGNAVSTTRYGAWVAREAGIELTDNSFDDAALLGIGCQDLRGTAHITNVRVQNCGYASPGLALSLAIVQSDPVSVMDVTIENCDILDTGVAADGTFTPGRAWGIATQYVSHLKISENRVRYPVATPLPATQEHRALKLIGVRADIIPTPGAPPVERAFGAALISGNVFQGPSVDRLVDVRREAITHESDLRFEKLTFSVNRCDHFGRTGQQNITADLYGSHMIVTSNQVKTPAKGHSFGFGARPRVATTSNYTTGDYVNVATTVPAVLTNFNVIV